MKPIDFPESNVTLGPPPNFSKHEDCGDLPIYTDGRVCLSCWEMSEAELQALLKTKFVWLYVWSGTTQPAVGFLVGDTPFMDNPQQEGVSNEKEENKPAPG